MKVEIVEVGPRDGLQNETQKLSVAQKQELVERLTAAGLSRIEVGSFVSPKKIPQMENSLELLMSLKRSSKISPSTYDKFSALVPNEQGMTEALKTPLKEVAIFAAVSETFSQKNINCSVKESLERFQPVVALAKKNKIRVRGYLSTCFWCPYEGKIKPKQVLKVVEQILDLGVFELSIGDTIGAATPKAVKALLQPLLKLSPAKKTAMHFHDTRGTALSNITESLQWGIQVFDSSVGGLGGCPYAPGASGNVATEDVVYLLKREGAKVSVDLEKLISVNKWLDKVLNRKLPSRVGQAGLPKHFS
ncbi:MAG: hydroxymethylglutaryl-CoA lyase [Bdellovibrionales bacterium]